MKNITKYAATALIMGVMLVSGSAHATTASADQSGNAQICEELQELYSRMRVQMMLFTEGNECQYMCDTGAKRSADEFINHMEAAAASFYYSAFSVYACTLHPAPSAEWNWQGPSPQQPHWPN